MDKPSRFDVLSERSYRLFVVGYGISYTLYWITLLAVGWWTWETTHSAAWVGFVFFCDLFPAVLITPWASALADRGDRFKFLKSVLWIQVGTGFALATVTLMGLLTPALLAVFVFIEGALIGFSQPAFFGLVNRLVKPANLSAAVGLNSSVTQSTYILGPLLAGLLFTQGLKIAPIAFAANAVGTLVYLAALTKISLYPEPPRDAQKPTVLKTDIFAGLDVFWKNPTVFKALVLILGVAILQRPLISLMPGINDRFELFDAARFTFLTASFMAGSVVAGLIHASKNSDAGLEAVTPKVLAGLLVLYSGFFLMLDWVETGYPVAMAALFLIGLGSSYIWTGNNIILQNRTPEHLRSRVLGNSFMLTRAIGAIAVVVTGLVVEQTGFVTGMIAVAVLVACLTPLVLRLRT